MADGLAGIGRSDEESRASISQARGKLAAKYPAGSDEQKKYISAQGDAETAERGGGKLAISKYNPKNWYQGIDASTQKDSMRGLPSLEK